jgi:uncharacterized repeat protein (TIGR01451 family)
MQLDKTLFSAAIALGAIACAATDTVGTSTANDAGKVSADATPTSPAALVLVASKTSPDGYITVTMSSSNQQDVAGVNSTYTWTAHNNSLTLAISGVTLGSNWGDYCGSSCTPSGPTLISLGAGCAGQGAADIPPTAKFGAWCTPTTGVTLAPNATVSGTVTFRPSSGGPPNYITYSLYNDPITGQQKGLIGETLIHDSNIVGPAPTDEQLTGSASTGSPVVGANYTYNYQIKNAGPWSTYGGVTFTDVLPTSLTYVGYTASPGTTCSAVGQTVTCQIPDHTNQNGQSSTLALTVTAPSTAQQIVNSASIGFTFPQTDSNAANNGVSITVASK